MEPWRLGYDAWKTASPPWYEEQAYDDPEDHDYEETEDDDS